MGALTALNPLFLYALPLATLPVVFHLFYRLRKRQRPFPTLMFFQRIDPRLSARRQLREWLILLLRTLMILFLLLALARPMWLGAGPGGNSAAVLIVDNSASMSGPAQGGESKLKVAIEAARAMVSGLQESDVATVQMLVDDPTVALPNGLTSDKTALKTGLDRITETEASGAAGQALGRALDILEESTATHFEVHIFTDLQETEWGKTAAQMRTPRAGTIVVVHRISSAPEKLANISIVAVTLPQKRLLAGRKFPVKVVLVNSTTRDGSVRLNTADDLGTKATQEIAVPKQEEKTAVLVLDPKAPGAHWLNVWLEGDELLSDNKAGLAYACTDKALVTFVGQREEFGLLPVALAPVGEGKLTGLIPQFTEQEVTAKNPVCVVVPWEKLAAHAAALRAYVMGGGNLVIVPALVGSSHQVPEWIHIAPQPQEQNAKGAPVLVFDKTAPVFADLRDEKGEVLQRNVKAFKFHPLKVPKYQVSLLGLEDGRVLLAQETVGKGTVFVSGLAFSPDWTTLTLKGTFLPLAQGMALAGGQNADTSIALVAGDRLRTLPGDAPSAHIQSVAGSPLDWKGEKSQIPAMPRSGVYLVQTDRANQYVSVRSSDKEGRLRFITTDDVPVLSGLAYVVKTYTDTASLLVEARQTARGFDLFLPLLFLALLALLAEGWLVNPLPRQTARPTPLPRPAIAQVS